MGRLRLAIIPMIAAMVVAVTVGSAQAGIIFTDFNDPNPPLGSTEFTVGSGLKQATFTGGETVFRGDPDLYASPPNAWLIAGAGAGGAGAVGVIDFLIDATMVSFFAINAANGQATVQFLDASGAILNTQTVTASVMSDPAAQISFSGGGIRQVRIINPGPASPPAPPYETFIDNFTAEIPTPGTVALMGLGLIGIGLVRRRRG